MKAMILTAGLGTRLRPLTERWPKPAVPFLGRPLFAYHLQALKAGGVSEVGINTHHLPEEMAACAQEETDRAGLGLTISHEPEIQGTGGGIRGLRDLLSDDVFVVWNGDNLFDLDLGPVLAAHRDSQAAATMVLLPMPEREKYASVDVNSDGEVRRVSGRGPGGQHLTPRHFAGVHVINPEVFDFMGPGPEDINKDVYPRMIAAGRPVRGHLISEVYWSDLGTPERYLRTQKDLLERERPLGVLEPLLPRAGMPCVDPRAEVHPEAQLGSAVYVGPNAQVASRAVLNRACVLEGTRIGPGEVVSGAIAWGVHRLPGWAA